MANEKRLIDANEAIERAKNSDKIVGSSIWEAGEVVEFLEDSPTVDAVEVVRCKDCEFCYYNSSNDTYKCRSMNGMYRTVKTDDFCSYGERKDNG